MALDLAPYEELTDKKVVVRYNVPDGDEKVLTELEGTLMAVAPNIGIMVRPKGKQQGELIKLEDLAEENPIEVAAASIRDLKPQSLKPVSVDDARKHLVERHGYKISEINPMSPTDAYSFHESLDHTDLGHNHNRGEASEQTASEQSESDSAE